MKVYRANIQVAVNSRNRLRYFILHNALVIGNSLYHNDSAAPRPAIEAGGHA